MGTEYDRGLILYRQHRWAMAAEEFRAELRAFPDSVMGHAMLGMSHLQLQQYDAAEAEICEAARLGPDVAYTHYALAYLVLRQRASWRLRAERHAEAREHLSQAIALEPFNPENLTLLAEVEADAERWVDCLALAERGLQMRPSHERCMWFRARSLWSVNRRGEAMDTLKQTLANNPEQAAAHRLMGWMLVQQNQFVPAFEHLEQSLRIDPGDDGAQQLWRQANVRRFPTLGGIWWDGKARIKGSLSAYCLLLAIVIGIHVFGVSAQDGARPVLIFGDILMGLAAARLQFRISAVSTRKLDRDRLLFETGILILSGAWLAAGMMAILFHLQLPGRNPLDPRALELILWLPAIPLFLLDVLGEEWMRPALRLVRRFRRQSGAQG